MNLTAEPMNPGAFSAFGALLEDGPARLVNQGRARRTDLVRVPPSARPAVLARYAIEASLFPIRIDVLERHPEADQVFVPLDEVASLVVVAPSGPDGRPVLAGARAFLPPPRSPFLYRAGTWHAPLFAVRAPGEFLMTMTETGADADCETVAVSPLLVIGPAGREGFA